MFSIEQSGKNKKEVPSSEK